MSLAKSPMWHHVVTYRRRVKGSFKSSRLARSITNGVVGKRCRQIYDSRFSTCTNSLTCAKRLALMPHFAAASFARVLSTWLFASSRKCGRSMEKTHISRRCRRLPGWPAGCLATLATLARLPCCLAALLPCCLGLAAWLDGQPAFLHWLSAWLHWVGWLGAWPSCWPHWLAGCLAAWLPNGMATDPCGRFLAREVFTFRSSPCAFLAEG